MRCEIRTIGLCVSLLLKQTSLMGEAKAVQKSRGKKRKSIMFRVLSHGTLPATHELNVKMIRNGNAFNGYRPN